MARPHLCCGTPMCADYDRDLDVTVGWHCGICGREIKRDAGEIDALRDRQADEAATRFPTIDPIRGGQVQ